MEIWNEAKYAIIYFRLGVVSVEYTGTYVDITRTAKVSRTNICEVDMVGQVMSL